MSENENVLGFETEDSETEEFHDGAEFGEFPEIDEDDANPECEYNTYVRVKNEYDEMLAKRNRVNRGGIIFIGASAVVFLALMFSLESKLIFLVLWIAVIIVAVSYLIHNEYKIYKLRLYLGYESEDNDDPESTDSDDEDAANDEESEENEE